MQGKLNKGNLGLSLSEDKFINQVTLYFILKIKWH